MLLNPLQWPDFYDPQPVEPKTFLERLPLVGWLFSQYQNYGPVIENINEQLVARSKPDSDVWSHDLEHQKTAQWVCEAIKKEYEWPNDYFIPDDSLEIVFQMPWDDLKIVEFIMLIEEELEFEVNEKIAPWNGTLGEFVDFLIDQQRRALSN